MLTRLSGAENNDRPGDFAKRWHSGCRAYPARVSTRALKMNPYGWARMIRRALLSHAMRDNDGGKRCLAPRYTSPFRHEITQWELGKNLRI